MKAVITVIGEDRIGIISKVTSVLSESKVNILDISQTILQQYFTMVMVVDLVEASTSLKKIKKNLNAAGEEIGVSIKVQHEEIFNAMHKL